MSKSKVKLTAAQQDRRIRRVIAKAMESYFRGLKKGPYPDSCVLGDPHCECRMGTYCKRMPDPDWRPPRQPRKTKQKVDGTVPMTGKEPK